ncbi:hypothetical protein BgiBS90_020147, partial [Biomphalaria glabrata]
TFSPWLYQHQTRVTLMIVRRFQTNRLLINGQLTLVGLMVNMKLNYPTVKLHFQATTRTVPKTQDIAKL